MASEFSGTDARFCTVVTPTLNSDAHTRMVVSRLTRRESRSWRADRIENKRQNLFRFPLIRQLSQ
eukprot:4285451-Prymnesium_polylepis.1